MLEIDYDTADEPKLAVGWGEDEYDLQQAMGWVRANGEPMIYGRPGVHWVFIHSPAADIEQGWDHVYGQEEAARRAREILRVNG
jgi:hypothetical protein